ncbi:hypothetical protein POL68_19670 [Stigmatella sp. ncwal1]|uniref:Carboxypeptidase regulatory-like domain-containing protein n=1 Tax=Stigmatella ashevillensis TaxID=2995309 RepID=A0ABT5DC83_9BACT|nr:hypothetical protein [Stigmatella ashevillena]MDC0710705.1 hypothetical protein [Stigmatella ashevillena]
MKLFGLGTARIGLTALALLLLASPSAMAATPERLDAALPRAKEWAPGVSVTATAENKKRPEVPGRVDLQRLTSRAAVGEVTPLGANNSPATAQYLDLNTQVSAPLATPNEQAWYYVYVPANGKVTAFVQTVNNASLDYDLYLYKYNPANGSLAAQAYSFYGPTHYEQASTSAAAGDIYFILVHAYVGADPVNPYTLAVLYSSLPDVDEPNDNPWQAKSAVDGLSAVRTLDNAFDEDWTVLTLTQENAFAVSLNTAATGAYQLHLFGTNIYGAPLATVSKNTQAVFTLPPGTWHVRVLSLDTVIPAEPYTVRVAVAAGSLTDIKILNHQGVEDYINYGQGYSWRVQTNATFQGVLKDRYGRVLPNTPVNLAVYTPKTYRKETFATGLSDANGAFSIPVELPAALGTLAYDFVFGAEYYDLASFSLSAEGASGTRHLYHYAYMRWYPTGL